MAKGDERGDGRVYCGGVSCPRVVEEREDSRRAAGSESVGVQAEGGGGAVEEWVQVGGVFVG